MKSKKEIESFEESRKSSELFNFAESNNQNQIPNSDFVFNYEDTTQNGSELKNEQAAGQEDNKQEAEEEVKTKEGLSKEDIDKFSKNSSESTSSSSSEASSASTGSSSGAASSGVSSTVTTVASVATTAVVVIVGGGLAVYGQSFEKPNICELSQVVAVENNIQFTLSLGNTLEQAQTVNENGEPCDVVVELLCPSMDDFVNEFKVSKFGQVSGEFNNLEYDTTYTVNVYQNSLLDLEKTYLLDPIEITTEPAIPANNILFTAEADPFGNVEYYSTVTYNGGVDLSQYEYFCIGTYPVENNPMEGTSDGPYVLRYSVDKDHLFEKTKAELADLVNYDEMYHVDFYAEAGNNPETGEDLREILVSVEVNFSKISVTPYQAKNYISFEQEYDGESEKYFAYADYTGSTSGYAYYILEVHYIDETPMDDTIATNRIELKSRTEYPIEFGNYSIYSTFTAILYGQKRTDDPSGEQVKLAENTVVFGTLPKKNLPNIKSVYFDEYYSNYGGGYKTIIGLTLFDPENVVDGMKLHISSDGENYDIYPISHQFDCYIVDGFSYNTGLYYVYITGLVNGEETELYPMNQIEISQVNATLFDGATSFSIGSSQSGYEVSVNKGNKQDYVHWRLEFKLDDPYDSFSVDIIDSQSAGTNDYTPIDREFDSSATWIVTTYACPYDGAEEQLIYLEEVDFSNIH